MLRRTGPPAPPMISTTAHNRYALRAFEELSVGYPWNPIAAARLADGRRTEDGVPRDRVRKVKRRLGR